MSSTMMSQSSTVAALRKAEKLAVEKINEARKRKQRRLKQAKEEAKSEIDALKEQLEKEFIDKQQEYDGNKDQFELSVDQMMKSELDKLSKSVAEKESKALSNLLNAVLNIEPNLHKNYK